MILICLFLVAALSSLGQSGIAVIDFVKIKEGRKKEALFFYENNWKVYRDIALKKNYISSYRLFSAGDSAGSFDLMLITEYADSAQLGLSEHRFNDIIKAIRPEGPKLLNRLKPNDFRQNVYSRKNDILFKGSSEP